MKLSVFCGVSVDGFLARPNYELNFLHTGEKVPSEFDEFFAGVDVVVMGRRTFEVVQRLGALEIYGSKPIVVLSGHLLVIPVGQGRIVERMSDEPSKIVKQLEARGFRHAYIDGGITIQRFLASGCIDRMTITLVPVLIGTGIPLFGSVPHDIGLVLLRSRSYPSGLVQNDYEIRDKK